MTNEQKIKNELMELILRIHANEIAYDEDLPSTWYHLKNKWNKVKELMDNHIIEND